jgi:predicted nucleotidyltransferase
MVITGKGEESMAEILDNFVAAIRTAYGANLAAVILYGSKAVQNEAGKGSDYNLLVVLKEVRFADLRSLEGSIGKWIKAGNQPPLLFTLDMFKESMDVFPVEFLDMRDNRKLLYGDDPFVDFMVLDQNLRHECEFELKSKLLKLRQGYMASGGKPKEVAALMAASISPVMVIFRHVVRLFGKEPPLKKQEALKVLAGLSGIGISVFETIQRIKHGEEKIRNLNIDSVMSEYLKEIEKIISLVDAMG